MNKPEFDSSARPFADSAPLALTVPSSTSSSDISSSVEALSIPLLSTPRDPLFDPTITLFDCAQFKQFLIEDKEERSKKPKRVRSSLNSLTLEEQVELAIRLSLGQAVEEDGAR